MNERFSPSEFRRQVKRDILVNLIVFITVVLIALIYLAVVYAPVIDKCADKMLWK